MKAQLKLLAISCLLVSISFCVFGQGTLTPPGAPAPTMKTLAQIEPRTLITSVPFSISAPGSYYLTTNLTTTVSNAILINANGVTLDLNGFTISSTVANAANGGTAILISSGRSDLTIYNGHIRGGVTNNGSGLYSGSGFSQGIVYTGVVPNNVRVSGVSVAGVLSTAIHIGNYNSSVAESCTVQTAGGGGIGACTIKGCVAMDCHSDAIFGNQVSDSRGASDDYYGISAETAVNCRGYSETSIGIASRTAVSCYGYSASGTGLSADTAQACFGVTDGDAGFGVRAWVANGCFGYNYAGGTGLWAPKLAVGCYGYAASGTGLSSYIANSSLGETSSGVAQAITHKYNMP